MDLDKCDVGYRRFEGRTIARSSTAARTAGLREVTEETRSYRLRPLQNSPYSHAKVNLIRLTWTCQPLAVRESL